MEKKVMGTISKEVITQEKHDRSHQYKWEQASALQERAIKQYKINET